MRLILTILFKPRLALVRVALLSFIRQRVDVSFKVPAIIKAFAAEFTPREGQLSELAGADPEICRGPRLGQKSW